MPVLKTIVDANTKSRFVDLAQKNGLSESEFLRLKIQDIINDNADSPLSLIEPDFDKTNLRQVRVRIPSFLFEAGIVRAKSKGMMLSRWVSSLVQSNLMRNPVMTNKQLGVLRLSNWQLASIGRNINQIARTLNEAFYKTEAVRLEKLAELDRAIKENKKIIYELIKASQNDWRAD